MKCIFVYAFCIFVYTLHIHKYTFCTFLFVNVCFVTATICYHDRLLGVFRAAFFRLYCENIRAHIKQIFAVVIIWFWSVRRTEAAAEAAKRNLASATGFHRRFTLLLLSQVSLSICLLSVPPFSRLLWRLIPFEHTFVNTTYANRTLSSLALPLERFSHFKELFFAFHSAFHTRIAKFNSSNCWRKVLMSLHSSCMSRN